MGVDAEWFALRDSDAALCQAWLQIRSMGNFRELEVWQVAKRLSVSIYRISRCLPYSERATLGDQMRRASVSVASNIAEGSGRWTDKQCVHYLRIARGSLQELQAQLEIAEELSMLQSSEVAELAKMADQTSRLLAGLIRYRSNPRRPKS